MRDKLLYGFGVAEVSQVAKYRDEALRLEGEGINVERGAAEWWIHDALVGYLVCEERSGNREEPRDEFVIANNVQSNRWNRE